MIERRLSGSLAGVLLLVCGLSLSSCGLIAPKPAVNLNAYQTVGTVELINPVDGDAYSNGQVINTDSAKIDIIPVPDSNTVVVDSVAIDSISLAGQDVGQGTQWYDTYARIGVVINIQNNMITFDSFLGANGVIQGPHVLRLWYRMYDQDPGLGRFVTSEQHVALSLVFDSQN